jgi:selenocysteine lyase/cysteine desulfurase
LWWQWGVASTPSTLTIRPRHTVNATQLTPHADTQVASQWVEVPLGSVRASLGYMSTWEDCHALAAFIEGHYKDRSA